MITFLTFFMERISLDEESEPLNTPGVEIPEHTQENVQTNKTWASYKPSDLSQKLGSPLRRRTSSVPSHSRDENMPGPSTVQKTPKKTTCNSCKVTHFLRCSCKI
ncbi:uncharacterized protein LOC123309227 isoform X2 [Coccinella septempunctata]|uniref:uncharacterized protein LOC123309227 isoform X2 n=1 Tax=Coccinella septempunctata TaxID=41139 RepID=UPI001D07E6FE|nr:uncharacterized protein LOC123309227 isoform X2 [Coccinella septempunctata]